MKNKSLLNGAMVIIIAVISIFSFSVMAFAAGKEYSEPDIMTTDVNYNTYSEDDNSVENMSRRNDDNSKPDITKIIIVAAVSSVVVVSVIVLFIYRSYKTNGMTEPYPYKQKAPLQLTETEDILIDTRVSKVKISRN